MPSVLYSTTCYIKNDSYRLSIYVDNNEKNSTDFTSTVIPIHAIIPSLTRLSFELVNDRKNTNIPKTIILNHLLSVEQTQASSNRDREVFNSTYDLFDTNETITPIKEVSKQPSQTTLETQISEVVMEPTPAIRRQFTFRRFFSTQSFADIQANLIFKTVINIRYVDVSNSIRWCIKKLKLDVESEDIANELYKNLNLCLSTLKQRPRHLLAFVNPFGGKGKKRADY
jgi:hypothetical protein